MSRRTFAAAAALFAVATTALVGCTSSGRVRMPPPTTSGTSSAHPSVHAAPGRHLRVQTLPVRLPEPLSRSVVFADSGSLLVCGGLTNGDRSVGQVWRVTPSSDSVRRVGTLAVAVHDAAGAVVSGSRVVIGGGAAHEVNVVQTCPTQGNGRDLGQLPKPSSDLVTAASATRTYVIGGYDGVRAETAVLETVDGVHFRAIGQLRVGVRYAAAVLGPDALWIYGGDVNRRATATVQRVDLKTGAVTTARMPSALSHASVVTLGGVTYLVGGRTATGEATSVIWRVDISTGAMHRAGALPVPVSDAGAVSTGTAAYLVGGEGRTRWRTVTELRLV